MEAFQTRVIDEKEALDLKREALKAFLPSGRFKTLPQDEQWRLIRQLAAMDAYSLVLDERIKAFLP